MSDYKIPVKKLVEVVLKGKTVKIIQHADKVEYDEGKVDSSRPSSRLGGKE